LRGDDGHSVVPRILLEFGTEEQKLRYLSAMATGEIGATMALTEPGGEADLRSMRTVARTRRRGLCHQRVQDPDHQCATLSAHCLLAETDPHAVPWHSGMSIMLVEQDAPGLTVSRDLPKLGYKSVESCELALDCVRVPRTSLLGGVEGHGSVQIMKGLGVGRIQVASRAVGVGRATLAYAQERETFGKPIWQHESIGNYLADMVTKLIAARQLILHAAERVDACERAMLEAGTAKLFASEAAIEIALNAVRIHGAMGTRRNSTSNDTSVVPH
jgi:alkylation response protein AidB-like acyl-CoA dehydrogenase